MVLLAASLAVAEADAIADAGGDGDGEGQATAAGRAVGLDGFAMPSRRPDGPALTRRAQAVADALARELGGCCRRAPAADDLSATLAAAAGL